MRSINLSIYGLALLYSSTILQTEAECPPFYGEARPPGWTPPNPHSVQTGTQVEHHCAIHTCNEDGSWSATRCKFYTCMEQIGYRDYDFTKAFPLCCPGPICRTGYPEK